jgi:hypothetical protein
VADTRPSREWLREKTLFEVPELALRAPPFQRTALDRRDAGRVLTPVFKPPQRIDQIVRYGRLSENPNDPAH